MKVLLYAVFKDLAAAGLKPDATYEATGLAFRVARLRGELGDKLGPSKLNCAVPAIGPAGRSRVQTYRSRLVNPH